METFCFSYVTLGSYLWRELFFVNRKAEARGGFVDVFVFNAIKVNWEGGGTPVNFSSDSNLF